MTELDGFWSMMFFVLGSIVGSFLNVCIVRLPHEKSVVFPASHCVHCKKPIAWYDNIPLISYLILGGKCRHCHKKYSFRYFFVELVTAVSFLLFYKYFGLKMILFPYLVMMCGFIVATFVDFEHRIIPDEISVLGIIAGVTFSGFIPLLHDASYEPTYYGRWAVGAIVLLALLLHGILFLIVKKEDEPAPEQSGPSIYEPIFYGTIAVGLVYIVLRAAGDFFNLPLTGLEGCLAALESAYIGAFVGGGSIYLMGILGDLIFRKESMGGGDVKLMAMVGAFMGWKYALLTFFLAPFFGAIYGLAEKIRTKESTIAYGPFLVLGALLSLFMGDVIIRWVMNNYGMTY